MRQCNLCFVRHLWQSTDLPSSNPLIVAESFQEWWYLILLHFSDYYFKSFLGTCFPVMLFLCFLLISRYILENTQNISLPYHFVLSIWLIWLATSENFGRLQILESDKSYIIQLHILFPNTSNNSYRLVKGWELLRAEETCQGSQAHSLISYLWD